MLEGMSSGFQIYSLQPLIKLGDCPDSKTCRNAIHVYVKSTGEGCE
jgi:hypothetical protein